MTVINTLVCNQEIGFMSADEMGSNQARDGYRTDKIVDTSAPGVHAVSGGSGSSNTLKLVLDQHRTKSDSVFAVAQTFAQAINQHKHDVIGGVLQGKYGLPEAAYQQGSLQLPNREATNANKIFEEYNQMVEVSNHPIREEVQAYVLTLGFDEQIQVYRSAWMSTHPTKIGIPWATIGSGQDFSDAVLGEYISKLSPKQRTNIDVLEGLETIVRATNKSMANPGVGGRVRLAVVNPEQTLFVDENNSNYAALAVRAHDQGLLKQEQLHGFLDRLVLQEEDYKTVRQELDAHAQKNGYHLAELATR